MVSQTSLEDHLIPVGILTGPTATGKSKIAIDYALQNKKIEIINADSLLVYRKMNIGTAKPSAEELTQVPHHLVDIRDPHEPFTAGEFKRNVQKAIQEIHSRGNRALIVGGTGFYLKTLLFGLWSVPPSQAQIKEELNQKSNSELYTTLLQIDPPSAQRIGPSDRYRLIRALELIQVTGKSLVQLQEEMPQQPDPQFHLWIIDRNNSELFPRIHCRTQEMIRSGLIEEYQQVSSQFPGARSLQAVGYAQVGDFLEGKVPPGRKVKEGLEGLQDEIELATRQLVKRQRTWFKNQVKQIPQARIFYLEEDRAELELALKKLYE